MILMLAHASFVLRYLCVTSNEPDSARFGVILGVDPGHNSRRDAISLELTARARLPLLRSSLIMKLAHALQKRR